MYWATGGNSNIQYIKNVVCLKSQTRIGYASGGGENSQMLGPNVLVLTVGNTSLSFKFTYPQSTNVMGKKAYETNAKHQFTCGNMTISVLDPNDGGMTTHGFSFVCNTADDVKIWYQIGYCFIWLTSVKEFYVDT